MADNKAPPSQRDCSPFVSQIPAADTSSEGHSYLHPALGYVTAIAAFWNNAVL